MKIDSKRLVLPSHTLIMLMYAVSLPIPPSVKLSIHNQCLNVSLAYPIYFTSNGLECHRPPDYKVYAGDIMRSGFIIKSGIWSCGILMYKLQRRQTHEYTKIGKDTSSAAQLLVVWRISESNELYTDAMLLEHGKGFDWNEDNLRELYRKNFGRFRLRPDSATETWSLNDNTALKTTFEIMNEGHLLNIIISEVEKDNNTRMPVHIDLER
jgi:hypothetical protein